MLYGEEKPAGATPGPRAAVERVRQGTGGRARLLGTGMWAALALLCLLAYAAARLRRSAVETDGRTGRPVANRKGALPPASWLPRPVDDAAVGERTATLARALERPALLLLATAAGARAVSLFPGPDRPELFASPYPWLALAVGSFIAATHARVPEQPWIQTAHSRPLDSGQVSVAVAAGIVAGAVAWFHLLDAAPQPALVTGWALGQALWLAALAAGWRGPARWSRGLLEAAAVVLVVVVAAVPRFLKLGELSPIFSTDMAFHGLQARAILAGQYADFFGPGWAGIPITGFVPTAVSFLAFGDSLRGLNVQPAVEGLVSLIGLYLLVRSLWGWRPALFAMALAAGNLHHLHYSRGADYIDPLPWTVWCLYFLVRGLRQGRTSDFGVAGLLAGWSTLMYYPGRMVLPLALAAVAVTGLAAPRTLWERRRGLAVAAVGLAVVLAPTLTSYVQHPGPFDERTQAVSIFNPPAWVHSAGKYHLSVADTTGVMAEQLRRSGLAYWKYNDAAPQFAIERNLLDPASGVLLIFGLGYAAWRIRRPGPQLILIWLVGYVIASTLTGDPPSSSRMLGQVLPVAALGGLALDRTLALLPRGRQWTALALALGLAVTAYSGVRNWQDYRTWAWAPQHAYTRNQVLTLLLAQPPDYEISLVSRQYAADHSDFAFLLRGRAVQSVDPDALARGAVSWPEEPAIFILAPEFRPLVAQLQERYPGGRLVDGSFPPLAGVFYAYYTR